MRAILVDWLVQVHSKFRLLQETLYMCVAIMDRFLQVSAALGAHCNGILQHRRVIPGRKDQKPLGEKPRHLRCHRGK